MGIDDLEGVFNIGNTPMQGLGDEEEGWVQKVSVADNELGYDAWGRSKSVQDFSLFHGVYTFGIPEEMWIEYISGVELTAFVNATSVDGMLCLQGVKGQSNYLHSKRHARYQPNRGHLYSSSVILPDANIDAIQEFGIFNSDSGVFFRVVSGVLYAVLRTKSGAVVSDIVDVVDLPSGIDLTKGNVYDIQMQWRGVGNIRFFVNLQLVHTMEILGTLDGLSMWNPALPIGFHVDGAAVMYCGCVDVTSEGGQQENRQRGSIDTDELSLAATEVPILVMRLPDKISYNGNDSFNTRDIALRRISGYADDNTIIKMYYTRRATKFAGTIWTDYDPNATIQYAVDGDIVIDNLLVGINRVITRRIPANGNIEITNADPEAGDFFLTHGDFIVITMKAKNATLGGIGAEWGAEI